MTTRGPHRLGVLLAAAALAASCGGTPEVGLCLRTAPDDPDPLGGRATSRVIRAIPLEGQPEQRFFSPGAGAMRLPGLEFGTWKFVVQALESDEVVATGQTPLVDVNDEHVTLPCVYVATVGTFGRTGNAAPNGVPRLAYTLPGSTTAIVVTDSGLVRYDHETGELSDAVALPFDATGAIWATLLDGRAAAVLRDGRAAILTSEGDVESIADVDVAVGALDGATAVGVGLRSVLVIGGATDATTPPAEGGSLRQVDLATGAVTPADSAAGLAVRDARVEPLGNLKFFVVGNNGGSAEAPVASPVVAIVEATRGLISTGTLDSPRLDPIVTVSGSNVLVLGGLDGQRVPTTTVEHFRVSVSNDQIAHLSADDDLNVPRAGGLALVTPQGIVVTGGATDSAAHDTTAERVSFDGPPVKCSAEPDGQGCDPPSVALPSPLAVTLHDGAILVVGRGASVVYRP